MADEQRHDPTYGQIDFDIQNYVDQVLHPFNLGQRVAMERTLQNMRDRGEAISTVDEHRKVTAAATEAEEATDRVNHPAHYTGHPSGVECITITEHMGFNLGNAVKYIWRADLKGDALEDLRKAAWYVGREIKRRTR